MDLDFPEMPGRDVDEVDAFCLFVDQLEAAIESLKTGRIALQRMSLVALDNLADILLQEFAEQSFLLSEELGLLPGRRYPRSRRRKIEGDFRRKVALASKDPNQRAPFSPPPILDAHDAAIFRIAHRYRNDVYHRNRHNPALMEPLTQLYAEAVGRAFVRATQKVWMGGAGLNERLGQLDRFDWRDAPGMDVFEPHEAAARITLQLCNFPELSTDELARALREDVEQRCALLADDLNDLKRDGLDDNQVQALFESTQVWAADRGDDEAIRLEEERSRIYQEVIDIEGWDDDHRSALEAVEKAQIARMDSINRGFVFPLRLEDIDDARQSAARLTGTASLVVMMEYYRQLDETVEQLELTLYWMVVTWDRYVQGEIDMRRGK